MQQKPTIGRIVEYFPGNKELPNGMKSAPAIVTQVFEPHVNLTVFVADPNGSATFTAWSVSHKDNQQESEGGAYWDWPQRETNPS